MTDKLIAAIDAVEAELAKGTPGPLSPGWLDTQLAGTQNKAFCLSVLGASKEQDAIDRRNIAALYNATPGVLKAARCELFSLDCAGLSAHTRDIGHRVIRAMLAPIFAQYADLKAVRDLEVEGGTS